MSYSSDIAFTEEVKAIQKRKGSRGAYERMEQNGGWATRITPQLADFIADQRSVFLGSANAQGQPYIQHRGGPAGFLKVLDDTHIAFADFKGNRQFITSGNLAENDQSFLFLIDYANSARVKIWGTARVVEDDPELLERLMPNTDQYRAHPEQVIIFHVKAWDRNCPQHIPRRHDEEVVARLIKDQADRITGMEEEITRLTFALETARRSSHDL